MGSASTRKMPNCFNFLRQLNIIKKSAGSSDLATFDDARFNQRLAL